MAHEAREKIIRAVVECYLQDPDALTVADIVESTGLSEACVRRNAAEAAELGLLEERSVHSDSGFLYKWIRSYRPSLTTMVRRLNIAERALGQAEYWLEEELNDNPAMTEPMEILRVIAAALQGKGEEN